MINAVNFSLGWLLRLYSDYYPDATPISYLQNFVAVPLNFMVVAQVFANFSQPLRAPQFALPANMTTVAVSATSAQRLVGQPWVVWTFAASACSLVLAVGGIRLWMLLQPRQPQAQAAVPEVAILARAGAGRAHLEARQQQQQQHGGGSGAGEGEEGASPQPQPQPQPSTDAPGYTTSLPDEETGRRAGEERGGSVRTLLDFVMDEQLADRSVAGLASRVRRRKVRLEQEQISTTPEGLCLYVEE